MTTTQSGPEASRTNDSAPSGDVVVGYDGSWHSQPALTRAAVEAAARGLPLTILSVVPSWAEEDERIAGCAAGQSTPEQDRQFATAQADAVADRLRASVPTLLVRVDVVLDSDTSRLRERLAHCRLLVLGDRGRQEVRAFLLGSTSRELLRAAHCPVLVVPADHPAGATPLHAPAASQVQARAVLVGMGAGDEAVRALQVAAEEALRRGRPLHVLRSYAGVAEEYRPQHAVRGWDAVQARLQEAQLDPGVRLTVILTPDPPVEALLQHGRLADLVVVGSRGQIALARLASDSVSRALLDAATWPVLVVPR